MNAYMKNVKCLPAAELYKDKNISLSLPIALSLSLRLALSACLKLPYVIFIILLFLFLTLEAYWVTRWKVLLQVTLYLFIESEGAEKSSANWVYEISGMTGKKKERKQQMTLVL